MEPTSYTSHLVPTKTCTCFPNPPPHVGRGPSWWGIQSTLLHSFPTCSPHGREKDGRPPSMRTVPPPGCPWLGNGWCEKGGEGEGQKEDLDGPISHHPRFFRSLSISKVCQVRPSGRWGSSSSDTVPPSYTKEGGSGKDRSHPSHSNPLWIVSGTVEKARERNHRFHSTDTKAKRTAATHNSDTKRQTCGT